MRFLILLFVLCGLAVLPGFCQSSAPKTYAEPLYKWVDSQGVEHIDVKSKIPQAQIKPPNKHNRFIRFCIGARDFTMHWITPILQTAGGIRSVLNP